MAPLKKSASSDDVSGCRLRRHTVAGARRWACHRSDRGGNRSIAANVMLAPGLPPNDIAKTGRPAHSAGSAIHRTPSACPSDSQLIFWPVPGTTCSWWRPIMAQRTSFFRSDDYYLCAKGTFRQGERYIPGNQIDHKDRDIIRLLKVGGIGA